MSPAAAAPLERTSSFGGVVPVALTNTEATASEATQGAPVTGPGVAQPFPPDAECAGMPSIPAKMDADEPDVQVSVSMAVASSVVTCHLLEFL